MDKLICLLRESIIRASGSEAHIWVQLFMLTISEPQLPPTECVALQDEIINRFSAETSPKLNY